MGKTFALEIAYSRDSVGVRVIAKPSGWGGASADIRVTGQMTPEEAIAFADALKAKAEEIAARNSKREAADQRRKERMSKLPAIAWGRQ